MRSMTRFLAADDITELATHEVVMAAAQDAIEADAHGSAVVPPRLDVDLPRGFLRTMPGAFADLMGLKVMTNVEGLGNRYLLLLYTQTDGELLAMFDAEEVTRLRTAGTTALAATLLQPEPQTELAMIGSGFEAVGHLRAMCQIWPLSRVSVYSPSEERRCAFAERMSAELSVDVVPVSTARAACRAADTVLMATKTTQPVLDGADLREGAVVLSIGSTRPKLRELDRKTLARTAALLVDHVHSVEVESGDIIDALEHEALGSEHLVSMGGWLNNGHVPSRTDSRDLLTFKSVGTIVQDLALAGALLAADQFAGRDLGELCRLKPFSATQPTA
jgi:alanine dehydrogenase